MRIYLKSLRAERDVREIFLYTRNRWSRDQAVAYLLGLEKTFETLAASPGLGKPRPELGTDVHSFPHKAHVIFYRQRNHRIEIIRVLHGSRDMEGAFLADQ
jgi:toxin ParE1/3/4